MTKTEDRIKDIIGASHADILEKVDRKNDKRILPIFAFGVVVGLIIVNVSPIGYLCGIVSGIVIGSHWPQISERWWGFVTSHCNLERFELAEMSLRTMRSVAPALSIDVTPKEDEVEK